MAACGGSLRSLFENPPPENPTLIESLSSWNQIKPTKPIEATSIAEIFGELYFQEKPALDLPLAADSPLPAPRQSGISEELDLKNGQTRENMTLDRLLGLSTNRYQRGNAKKNGGVFSAKNSESLLMCTEGLGSESSDDVDDLMEHGDDWRSWGEGEMDTGRRRSLMPSRVNGYTRCAKEFPPPISSIGRSGRPWVCLRSYREDGRFVLREVRIPCQEWLRASREDGRLKLHFVHPDEGVEEGEEEEEEKENAEEEQVLVGTEEKKNADGSIV
ncbi:protein FANTASTIC FOUR 3 [Iris pallida]|uniref:Protein FANTASTIC FOUR 3 n=1 Tax=Iris pallida TaxID=29817 RepID=A0AAX6E2Q5_IRIPA|nr:protein FANTASTIC FOUR 3 [Iris pallida]